MRLKINELGIFHRYIQETGNVLLNTVGDVGGDELSEILTKKYK